MLQVACNSTIEETLKALMYAIGFANKFTLDQQSTFFTWIEDGPKWFMKSINNSSDVFNISLY